MTKFRAERSEVARGMGPVRARRRGVRSVVLAMEDMVVGGICSDEERREGYLKQKGRVMLLESSLSKKPEI